MILLKFYILTVFYKLLFDLNREYLEINNSVFLFINKILKLKKYNSYNNYKHISNLFILNFLIFFLKMQIIFNITNIKDENTKQNSLILDYMIL